MKNKLLAQCVMMPAMLLVTFIAAAQTRVLKGKVVDETQSPLTGATVKVKGTTTATTTDAEGTFSLNIPNEAKFLEVSYIGYALKEVPIVGSDMSIALEPSTDQGLEEVVVIGYGTARKKDLTGSMVTIGAKNFNKGIMTSPDQLIQGKAPGVMVINNTGQPGGATTVRIRGNSSIRSSNDPLFVLDGVPMSGNAPLAGGRDGFSSDRGNPLSYLNPGDIASMDILKDASATAIYGSRGANGVVIITTKRGRVGSPEFSVGASTGISSIRNYPKVLNASQFREAVAYYRPDELADADYGDDVDAMKAITRKAVTQNYYADVVGGTENGKYRISGGYLNQNGIIRGSQLKKYTANLSGNFKFLENKRLGLDFAVFLTQLDNKYAATSYNVGTDGNIISQALQWNPTQPLRDKDGKLTLISPNQRNPLASLEGFKDVATTNTMVVNVAPYYKITDDLEYRFVYSAMRLTGNRNGLFRAGIFDPTKAKEEQSFISNNGETNLQMTHTLSYNKELNDDWSINALAGYEYLNYNSNNNITAAGGFDFYGIDYYNYLQYSTVGTRDIASYRSPKNELQSLFFRGGINYLDRYLLTATVRRDGSTKFGKNNKYAIFPSLAVAWNLNQEEFLKSSGLFDQLKLRLGWGKTGNQEFPSGAALNRFAFGPGQSISQVNFENKDLKWETSTTLNVGLDFGVWGNRLYGSIDVFNKKTTDALFEQTLAQDAPAGRVWVNLDGEIVNKGVEISLTGTFVKNNNWLWDLTANAAFLKNSVSGLRGEYETAELRGKGFSGVVGQQMANGQPLNVWYLADYQGIDPATGMSMYRGMDGSISAANDPAENKFYLHSPNPTTLLGLTSNVNYKKFTLTANMNGAFGHYLFNNTAATVLGISNLSTRNIGVNTFDKTVKESTDNSASPSSRYLEKGDYLKLANLSLSYKLGDIGKTFKNMNISLTGQNLFIITKYTGFDPEVNTDGSHNGIPSLGIEYLPYPPARNILLGVNFSL